MRESPSGASTIVALPLTTTVHPAGATNVWPATVVLGVSAASACGLAGAARDRPHPKVRSAKRVVFAISHLRDASLKALPGTLSGRDEPNPVPLDHLQVRRKRSGRLEEPALRPSPRARRLERAQRLERLGRQPDPGA